MSRLRDSILQKGRGYAGHSPVANLAYGGQSGHTPAIGRVGRDGVNYAEWISNQSYTRQNVIPVVLDYPRGFDLLPDKQILINTYNSVMTLHPLTISGLSSGLTAEFDEHNIGGGGEMQQDLTGMGRARTQITNTYKEKNGKAIQKFIDFVMRYFYSDPDVEKPLITNITSDTFGGMYTPDYFTGTNLYIEPDITQRIVVDAWLSTNIMFMNNGDRTGSMDRPSPRSTLDLSIPLTSITMSNEAVMQLADKTLQDLNVLRANPNLDMVVPQSIIEPSLLAGATGFNSPSFNSVPVVA